MLSQLLKDLDRAIAADLTDYENLHRVRIAGKRLRYAMEVFAESFPPALRETLYPDVEQMQEILGLANDSHVAGRWLQSLRKKLRTALPVEWCRWQPGAEALIRIHRRRLPLQRRRFFAWWDRWQASGAAATFTDMLKE